MCDETCGFLYQIYIYIWANKVNGKSFKNFIDQGHIVKQLCNTSNVLFYTNG